MSGLMVYLPSASGNSPALLRERGCGDLLDANLTPLFWPAGGNTPDGGHGLLVVFDDTGRPRGSTPTLIDRELQSWVPAPKDGDQAMGRYWVGYSRSRKPGPYDLVRYEILDGLPVKLSDGQPWIVPIADLLPQRLSRDPASGDEITVPREIDREFCAWANRLFNHFMSDGFHAIVEREHRIKIPGGMAFAGVALAKNYRVNATVVDLLELVDEIQAVEIACVACGLPAFADLAKKKSMSTPGTIAN